MRDPTGDITLGITNDQVALGSHVVHFWQSEEEFERGVRFLELGIANESQYCVLFGHDEANQRVLEILRKTCGDLDRVLREGRLVILLRESSALATLANIEAAFADAVRKGATVIRFLGNLGMGRAPLPGRGPHEVAELENRVTTLARRYPCVFVCMFDISTVSGWLVLNVGFGTHPLAVCGHALRQNPYFTPDENALPVRRAAQ